MSEIKKLLERNKELEQENATLTKHLLYICEAIKKDKKESLYLYLNEMDFPKKISKTEKTKYHHLYHDDNHDDDNIISSD